MNSNLTDLTLILDRSGSMEQVADATIAAYNELLADQRAQGSNVSFSLVQFDDEYEEMVVAVPIAVVPPLTGDSFVPRGSTALLDALGLTIDRVGARLAGMPEQERPAKVIVALITDGHENASTAYTRHRVTKMVRRQEQKYGWTFMFLGAGLDAIDQAAQLGVSAVMAGQYSADRDGVGHAVGSLSRNVSRVRRGDRSGFTSDERTSMAR